MAGFKRSGFRSAGGSAPMKGYARKRSPDVDDDTPRASKKSKGDDEEEEEEEEEEEYEASFVPKLQEDDDSNSYVALNNSGKRRITVSDFKGMTLVSIREYYVNDAGEFKPGKKGISLSLDQYNTLLTAVPLLESVLNKKDVKVARPDYEANPATTEPARHKVEDLQTGATIDHDDDEE